MTLDLRELAARESERVEWKRNVADPNDVVRSLVAMANDYQNLGGGYVVCGAEETKDEAGFPAVGLHGLSANRLREVEGTVMARCRQQVSPPIAPLLHELPGDVPERRVLIFEVVATGRAHLFRDDNGSRYWVRVGRSTIEARNGTLQRLLAAKGEVEPWDRRLCAAAVVEDLDLIALRDSLVRMGRWDPARGIDYWLNPDNVLSAFIPSLTARDGGVIRPRNFAVLLFGREPQRFIPGAHARFSAYPGVDRAEPYAEKLDLDGTLVSQANRLIERLNIEASTVMDKSTNEAENIARYPRRALKEAVVNALVHRDYAQDHPVRVVAFVDRVEIWSPGGLDPKVPEDEFLRGSASPVWRNQSLAWIFEKLELAQGEGQGIATIQRSMAREGCPPPIFTFTEDSVKCTLPAHPRHARMRELVRIEQDIALGHVGAATAGLERLLSEDPYNFRTVALLTEIARSTRDDAAVMRFVDQHQHELGRFPAAAQLALADALTLGRAVDGSIPAQRAAWIRALLLRAGQGRMELADARRLVLAHLSVRDEQSALDVLDRLVRDRPEWLDEPGLLQLRGRTWLQFAKRCGQTLRNRELTPRLRRSTRAELSRYLERAEAALRAAMDHGASGVVREHADDDLRFLERLRQTHGVAR